MCSYNVVHVYENVQIIIKILFMLASALYRGMLCLGDSKHLFQRLPDYQERFEVCTNIPRVEPHTGTKLEVNSTKVQREGGRERVCVLAK